MYLTADKEKEIITVELEVNKITREIEKFANKFESDKLPSLFYRELDNLEFELITKGKPIIKEEIR